MTEIVEWHSPTSVDDEPLPEEALQRRLPEIQALQPHEFLTVNLDIPSLLTTVLGALPAIHTLLPECQRRLSDFDMSLAAQVRDYAIILNYAHAGCLTAKRRTRCPPQVIKEARMLRARLLSSLTAFTHLGLVDRSRWKRLQGTSGHLDLATDLSVLVAIFEQTPVLLRDHSLVSRADLDRGRALCSSIYTFTGRRHRTPEESAAAAELRVRVYTLLLNAYHAIRRAALYLRWQRDEGDKLVPSLFNQHRTRRRRTKEMERQTAVAGDASRAIATATATADERAAQPTASVAKLN